MAACTRFTCNHCGFAVDSWDDGHFYLTDPEGKRHYFYHPGDREEMRAFVEQQTGVEPDEGSFTAFVNEHGGHEGEYLCMNCGCETRRDPERDAMLCKGCHRDELLNAMDLQDRACPKCRKGIFAGELSAIS